MIRIRDYTVQEFENILENGRSIVAFGAGEALQNLCQKYSELSRNLSCVVDNFQSGAVLIEKRQIPIVRPDQLKREENQLFIITSIWYADEWIQQLDQMPAYNGMVFYLPFCFTREYGGGIVSCPGRKQLIPKTIHYCWFGSKELPQKFQKNIETWRKYCPDYEIVCWNESNYDVSKNLYMKQAYEAKKWGFVPDYARLDILYTYGGVYLDTDVELLRSLDDLLQYPFFCGFESEAYIALGLGFGSQRGDPILRDMLNQYDQMTFVKEDGSLNLIASPTYQTQILSQYGLVRNGCTQITEQFTALSPEYLCPVNPYGVGQPTARSFSIHQYAATWFDECQQANKERMMCNCKLVLSRMEHRD